MCSPLAVSTILAFARKHRGVIFLEICSGVVYNN